MIYSHFAKYSHKKRAITFRKSAIGRDIEDYREGTKDMTMENQSICKLYTYPCAGTGGHTESVRIYGNGIDESASWDGYAEDGDTLTFDSPFTLESGKTYNYVIKTSSYPQIHHTANLSTPAGFII